MSDDLLNDRRHPPGEVLEYGETFEIDDGGMFVVDDPCESRHGRWYCVPHAVAPNYQQNAVDHNTPKCRWVWVCYAHIKDGAVETVKQGRKKRT